MYYKDLPTKMTSNKFTRRTHHERDVIGCYGNVFKISISNMSSKPQKTLLGVT